MKRDVAERFAACAVEGINLDQARLIINEYVSSLARCSVCEGSGTLKFPHKIQIDELQDRKGGLLHVDARVIPAGTVLSCFRCGPDLFGNRGPRGKDPSAVAWHCTLGEAVQPCQNAKGSDQAGQDRHLDCGYRIMMPFDPGLLPVQTEG